MGEAVQTTSSWPGYSGLKHLVIFGDSYSDVGYNSRSRHPRPEEPLGVDFPGITWTEQDQPNWVGHLVTKYTPNPLLVYDYAVGGDTIAGVKRQVERQFLPHVGQKPDWAPWTAEDTLFVTWIGINDISWQGVALPGMSELFELQHSLYETGARNFCFIDVPPIERAPIGSSRSSSLYDSWNRRLREHCKAFAADHPDASVFIYSAHRTFSRILNDPISHGFSSLDTVTAFGEVWVDQVHPTSRIHDWVAKDFAAFLYNRKPYEEAEGDTDSASDLKEGASIAESSAPSSTMA
ncbi:hypothetical protein GLOTRDRAFT_57235 [Gloeophyllum trabeum ATCC 11539]|uniref:Uncharacterized protein n=1 Tax=Gloeophyllum trabeum (strain ATCC 11539 / FP-39264 / Madison 617) TaxID=670483 RepID=S7QGL4_GLOTA|nr:uncharacterized protein GLOTRDRAFT_57235 [Gloeophyllum trabeum ATCC 11539]EPQ58338.1 hypothetical protein GLOTRDRAFT_57235 [Gloeophyllum trabeum ATCC 11539]